MPKKSCDILNASQAPKAREIESAYNAAKARYAALGVDVDAAIRAALNVPLSLHCWQTDDVAGLDTRESGGAGGLAVTGNYPGAARNAQEIRADLDFATSLIPGKLRINLHSMYPENGGESVGRDKIEPKHFQNWVDWAKKRRLGLDFNPSPFGHPMVKDGLTLSSPDRKVRDFWTRHCKAARAVAGSIAKQLGDCVFNVWVPDGSKDEPADRLAPRQRLQKSLDAIFKTKYRGVYDMVESKLFGIGCESYTVGSNEFYMTYTLQHKDVGICFDMGHFHPTESIADKVSAVAPHMKKLLFHISRGVRWDSDHVCLLSKEVQDLCDELVMGQFIGKSAIGLDYFDGSINRMGAYAIGARAVRKGLLRAFLMPTQLLRDVENAGQNAYRLALQEYRLELPFGAVWDYCCHKAKSPVGISWIADVDAHEKSILSKRGS